MKKINLATAFSLSALLLGNGAQAAPATKQATGSDLTGNTAGVWSGGGGANGSPGSGDVATWNSSALGAGLTLTNSETWGGISVSGGLTDIAVTGAGTLSLGSSGINLSSSPNNFTWGTPVTLGASQTWVPATQASGITLGVSGSVSGPGYNLTIGTVVAGGNTQQGAVVLSGLVNNFEGVTIVNGSLVLTNGQTTITNVTIDEWNKAKSVNTWLYVTNGGTLIFNSIGISVQNTGAHVSPSVYVDNGTLESAGTATIASGIPVYVNPAGLTVNTVGGNLTSSSPFAHGSGSPDGGLTVTGGNVFTLASGSSYTGGTRINAGTVSLVSGTSLGSSGTIAFTGNSTLQWGAGVTADLSGRLQINDGVTGTIDTGANNVSFANPLTLDTDGTGGLAKQGSGTLTLFAENTYTGNTTINAGTLALGAGGSIANSGNLSVTNGGVFDVSAVSGGFTLGSFQTLAGSGTVNGPVTANGTLLPGSGPNVGTLTFDNDLTINGNLVFKLNKSLAQSNDVISVLGVLTNSGTGTLTVTNQGPALVVGDRFVLFSQSVAAGNSLAIAAPAGVTFTNNLAVDGSLTVLTAPPAVATNPTNLTASVNGNTLTLAWPADHTGWRLLAQTNHLSFGFSANPNDWTTVSGSATTNRSAVIINPAQPAGFFRLVYP